MHVPVSRLSLWEEIANSITGGVGLALSIAGLAVLVVLASLYGNTWEVVTSAVYGSTLVLSYLATTLYHSFPFPRVKRVFHALDHAAIYLLIAGTYTPFVLVTLRGAWGWSLFGIVWGVALIGVIFKIFFTGRFPLVSTTVYVALGWVALVAIRPMMANLATPALWMVVLGGVCYTGGVLFYALGHRVPFFHAVWHVFVLGGSTLHYFAILLWVVL